MLSKRGFFHVSSWDSEVDNEQFHTRAEYRVEILESYI